MKKLLDKYNMNDNEEYYEMCQLSWINGQLTQATAQFVSMPELNKKEMVWELIKEGDGQGSKMTYFFFKNI